MANQKDPSSHQLSVNIPMNLATNIHTVSIEKGVNMSVVVRESLEEKFAEVTPREESKAWAKERISANRVSRARQDMLTRAGKFRTKKGKWRLFRNTNTKTRKVQ